MSNIGDALRLAFIPKHEYASLREEENPWEKVQKLLISLSVALVSLSVLISTVISLKIVFPNDNLRRPFCRDLQIQPLSINFTSTGIGGGESALSAGAFVLTDQETVDYYWTVAFVPSAMVFAVSVVYLVAGITVAYSAPVRHGCMKVVENNYCASRRGGARCLSILNVIFAIIFGLLALFFGSTLLTLGSSCSMPLFGCYEIASWGLVILHGGTALFIKRKAAVIIDGNDLTSRNLGIEMLEANIIEVTPDVERRVNDGFKAWMSPSILSSDEEEDPDNYLEVPNIVPTKSINQRV